MDSGSPKRNETNSDAHASDLDGERFLIAEKDVEQGLSKPRQSPSMPTGHSKILRLVVIDNHHLFREGMLRLLIMEGDFAPVTGNYHETRELMRHFWPDLLVFGLGPIEQAGMQTAKLLRGEFPQIPLLLLDETVRYRHVREALAAKCHGYWTKHASFAQLVSAMRGITSGGKSFCPEVEKRLRKTPDGLRFDPPHDHPDIAILSHRENELFLLIAQGYTIGQSAELMGISESTASNHRARIMRKLKLRDNAQVLRLAMKEGLLE
jgi:DNA-binding NarL/FixJ family response regulator